jgi:cell division protein FtsN
VLLSEQRARELASQIRVAGQSPRVIASPRDGATVYRVVMGPFPTREEADRAARESKQQSYWIYEGAP